MLVLQASLAGRLPLQRHRLRGWKNNNTDKKCGRKTRAKRTRAKKNADQPRFFQMQKGKNVD